MGCQPGSSESAPFFNLIGPWVVALLAEVTLFQRGTANLTHCYKQLSQPMPCPRCPQHVRYRLDRAVAHRLCLDHVADEEEQVGAKLGGAKPILQRGSRWKATSSTRSTEALPRRFKPRNVSTVRASHDIQDVTRVDRTDQRSQDHFLRLFTR